MGPVFDAVFLVFGLLNLPVLVAVGMLVGLLNETVQAPLWVQLVAGSLTMWNGGYLLARLAEWRAWLNVPVSLHLVDPSDSGKISINSCTCGGGSAVEFLVDLDAVAVQGDLGRVSRRSV